MAQKIKGITIEIGGDVQPLNKALKDVNEKSRGLQSELRQVERLLKLDPSNTELLAQKQKLLSEAVENSKEKLERLRKAQEDIIEQYKRGDIGEAQYRAFQREVIKSEQALKKLEKQFSDTLDSTSKFDKNIIESERSLKDFANSLSNIGQKFSLGITTPLVGFMALATQETKEFGMELAKLETNAQVAGADISVLNGAMKELSAVTGELDSNVEGLSNLIAAGFDGTQMKQAMEQIAGAAIKFKDTLNFEGIADGLQETLATGAAIGPFAELLDRLGVSLDVFNTGLQEAIKNGTEQQYVLDVLAKQGLADVYKQYKKNNQELFENAQAMYDLEAAMAELGKTALPIITEITERFEQMTNYFNDLSPSAKKATIVIAGIAVALGPVLTIIANIVRIWPAFIGGLATIGGPAGIAIGVLGSLALAFVKYRNEIDAAINSFDTWMRKQAWFKAIGGRQLNEIFPERSTTDVGAFRRADVASQNEYEQITSSANAATNALVDFKSSYTGLGNSVSSAGGEISKSAENTRAAWEKTADILSTKLQIISTQYDTAALSTEHLKSKTQELADKHNYLSKQLEFQKEIVAAVNKGYQESVQAKGENAEETLKLKLRLEQERKTQADLERQLYDTAQAIKDQAQQLRDLAAEVDEVERKYREDLAAAAEEYQERVKEVNNKLIEDERRVTEEYEKAVEDRADALANFVDLFDAVENRDVSGEQLLENLRGQVDAFENWQKNIAELAARGVDEGLIEELRQMGPKAGPEIAALNTLTDEQLTEYVALWQEKNQAAREEAVNQLQQQRIEMQQELIEIRQAAQEQLEQYRIEWQQKNAEIRKNAEEEMDRIEQRFQEIAESSTKHGVQLVVGFMEGMESKFDALREKMNEMANIIDMGIRSPMEINSPSKLMARYGGYIVDGLIKGIQSSMSGLNNIANQLTGLAGISVSSLELASAGNTTNNYNSGGNTFHIYVQGTSAEEVLEKLKREVHKIGERW